MEVMLFGQLGDIIGSQKIEVDNVNNTSELRRQLEARFPSLTGVRYMIAVNKQLVTAETMLEGNETIALMPPFSGG